MRSFDKLRMTGKEHWMTAKVVLVFMTTYENQVTPISERSK
jgi:hypothetical protein